MLLLHQYTIPPNFDKCNSLLYLVLNNNKIRGPPPLFLCPLPSLTGLYIANRSASQYILELNFEYLHSEIQCLFLFICADALCTHILYHWDTTGPTIFSIRPSSFYFYCPLCNLCHGWQLGYDLTVYSYVESNWEFLPYTPYNTTSNTTSWYAHGLCQTSWCGITCANGLVTSIQLPSLGLSGTLPTTVGYMSGLSALELVSNAIRGPIPTTLAYLHSLSTSLLTNNHINGQIPSQFSALQSLVYLDLNYNSLTGSVPTFFHNLPQLAVMYVDGNSFSGQVSSELCQYAVQKNITV